VFFSNEIGFRKPERESYMHVLDSLKINPEESLMIDDLKENIEGASDAGMKIIHLEDYTLLGKRLSTLL
jgi:putative hydrolase of the HAD superfamily